MSYTSELQMPSNYVAMSEEEKLYLEGGYRASRQVYVQAGSKRMSKVDYMNMEFLKSTLASFLIGKIVGIGGEVLAIASTTQHRLEAATAIIGFLGGNGLSKAEALDRQDGSYDGMLTISWDGFVRTESNPYPPNSYEGAMF